MQYRKLVRMHTAMNRAKAKGLCEAVHTSRENHECFMSHDTWFLDMKFPMWKIQTAMGLTQAKDSTRRETDTMQESEGDAATTASDESRTS